MGSQRDRHDWSTEQQQATATWMDLDIIILSAVSQTKKDKYYMFSVICGIKKKLYEWTYIQNINRHRKQAYGWQKGKQGRDKLV